MRDFLEMIKICLAAIGVMVIIMLITSSIMDMYKPQLDFKLNNKNYLLRKPLYDYIIALENKAGMYKERKSFA